MNSNPHEPLYGDVTGYLTLQPIFGTRMATCFIIGEVIGNCPWGSKSWRRVVHMKTSVACARKANFGLSVKLTTDGVGWGRTRSPLSPPSQ